MPLLAGKIRQPLAKSSRYCLPKKTNFTNHWINQPTEAHTKNQIPPVTGEIIPLSGISKTQNPQSLDNSARSTMPQKPDSTSRWRNQPTEAHIKDQIPPVTGKINPLAHSKETNFTNHWRNQPAHVSPSGQNPPATGKICPLSSNSKNQNLPATGEIHPLAHAPRVPITPVAGEMRPHQSPEEPRRHPASTAAHLHRRHQHRQSYPQLRRNPLSYPLIHIFRSRSPNHRATG